MSTIDPALLPFFIDAGWAPNRSVPVPSTIAPDHQAYPVLAAFGGLTVKVRLPEPHCTATWLRFRAPSSVHPVVQAWSIEVRSRFFGVAEDMHEGICVDESGRYFCISYIHDAFCFVGDTLSDAIWCHFLYRRARPMLLPSEKDVYLYGELFSAGDPEIYRY